MKTYSTVFEFAKRQWRIIAVAVALAAPSGTVFADIHLDMLKTRTDSYTNVTVYGRSKTDIFIRHDHGIANIKLANLSPEMLAHLDSGGTSANPSTTTDAAGDSKEFEPSGSDPTKSSTAASAKLNEKMRQQMMAGMAAFKTISGKVNLNRSFLGIFAGALVVFYLFFCYCVKLICEKTGNNPGILVWIPLLQMIPMFRAAGMSPWWIFGLFLPLINLITFIMLYFKLVQARGKSVWVAIGFLFPLTYPISLLYLAFSDGKSGDESGGSRKLSVRPPGLPSEA